MRHGAEEYVLHPSAGDVTAFLALLEGSKTAHFHLDHKVLMSDNCSVATAEAPREN